jgi:Kef-type K+ transport system membrane component KefB
MAAEIGILLLKLVILLGAAKLAGELAERLRQPAVLGELLVGVLLGPTLLGFVDFSAPDADGSLAILRFVAELGVLLLLFEVGLETRLRDMAKVGRSAFLVALLGIAGSFLAGFAISYLLGVVGFWSADLLFHVFVGATFTATSVGITARVLSDMGRLATPEARIILGAAVLDDVGGLLILGIVVALAAGALDPLSVARQAALAIGFLVIVVAVGLKVMPWVVDRLSHAKARGVLLAAAFGFALLLAFLAEQVHLAAIVGAFAAGAVLAATRKQHELSEKVRHLGDVFVPFFFVYVGLQVDLRGVGADAGRLALAVAVLSAVAILGKLVAGLGVLEKGLDRLAVGVGMVPRGEVGLIFALVGLTTMVGGKPLMEPWEYTAILLVVAITTFVTPLWLKHVLGRKPTKSVAEDGPEA